MPNRIVSLLVSLPFAATTMLACSSSNSDELREQLSTLQTQLAEPTPTAPATVVPTPEIQDEFCAGVEDWLAAAQNAEVQFNARESTAPSEPIYDAYHKAFSVIVPIPPPEQSAATLLWDSVQEWNAASEAMLNSFRLVRAITGASDNGLTADQVLARIEVLTDAISEANSIARRLNPMLVAVCGLQPLDPYADETP